MWFFRHSYPELWISNVVFTSYNADKRKMMILNDNFRRLDGIMDVLIMRTMSKELNN